MSGPALPTPDADGHYPAKETLDVIVARQIILRRQAAGWTRAELAERAGVRQQTVSRIESGKHAPNVSTVNRLDRALRQAGARWKVGIGAIFALCVLGELTGVILQTTMPW